LVRWKSGLAVPIDAGEVKTDEADPCSHQGLRSRNG
jgi:hypothetical protein